MTDPLASYGLQSYPNPETGTLQAKRSGALSRRILQWLGWQVDFTGLPAAQGILAVYPHTSNVDFLYGVLFKSAIGMPLKFWIKDSFTKMPLVGAWIKWLGGIGINRRAAHGVVEQTLDAMRTSPFFWLAVAPEGTRSYTNGWRTGFYHVWQAADCPLGLAYFDYSKKHVGVLHFARCSGNIEADFAGLARYYASKVGYKPEQAAPVQPYVRNRSSHF